jgi:hypothetical protein
MKKTKKFLVLCMCIAMLTGCTNSVYNEEHFERGLQSVVQNNDAFGGDAANVLKDEDLECEKSELPVDIEVADDLNQVDVSEVDTDDVLEEVVIEDEAESSREEDSVDDKNTEAIQNSAPSPIENSAPSQIESKKEIEAGNKIRIIERVFDMTDSIPKGNLTDGQYQIVCEILDVLKNASGEEAQLPTLYYGTINEANAAIDFLEEYLKIDIFGSRFPCDANGLCWVKEKPYIKITINLTSTRAKMEKEKAYYDMVMDALNKAGVYNGMTELEAVTNIANWISEHMTYVINNGREEVGFTTGQGQCMTYALMFRAMCNAAGIECEFIAGYVPGGTHAWNRVKIGDELYWIDVTGYDADPGFYEKYFLTDTLWGCYTVSEEITEWYR